MNALLGALLEILLTEVCAPLVGVAGINGVDGVDGAWGEEYGMKCLWGKGQASQQASANVVVMFKQREHYLTFHAY